LPLTLGGGEGGGDGVRGMKPNPGPREFLSGTTGWMLEYVP